MCNGGCDGFDEIGGAGYICADEWQAQPFEFLDLAEERRAGLGVNLREDDLRVGRVELFDLGTVGGLIGYEIDIGHNGATVTLEGILNWCLERLRRLIGAKDHRCPGIALLNRIVGHCDTEQVVGRRAAPDILANQVIKLCGATDDDIRYLALLQDGQNSLSLNRGWADNQIDLIDVDKLAQSGNSINGVTAGIGGDDLHLAPKNAAIRVNLIGGHLHAFEDIGADEGFKAAKGANHSHLNRAGVRATAAAAVATTATASGQ